MAITVGDKTYRNLPEQVEENANNIEWLKQTISEFGNVMRYCGSVATYADLPADDNRVGDVYNVLDTGNNYAWDGEAWDEISSIVDLTGYVQKVCIAPTYASDSIYYTNQIVFHDDKLYRAKVDILTPEEWDASHWQQISIHSDFVNTFGSQPIGGRKTFTDLVQFGNSDRSISTVGNVLIIANREYHGYVEICAENTYYIFDDDVFHPQVNNANDLGKSSYTWRNLYMSGVINPNASGYGLSLPSTASLTANSEIIDNSSDQTITGKKILSSGLFYTDKTGIFGSDAAFEIKINNSNRYVAYYTSFGPENNGASDLGTNTWKWRDLYLTRNLTDGTNSVTVADISNGLFNVINASDIVDNTLTQAQYDLITNGKPTIIVGTIINYLNPILLPCGSENYNVKRGLFTGNAGYSTDLRTYQINTSTKVLSFQPPLRFGSDGLISNFNNKTIPSYPADTGTFVLKCVDGVLTWVAE